MSQLSYTNLINGDQPQASGFNSRFLLAINLLNSGIEADNIASSAVTAAKISSGAVTLAKMESGTQGDILYYGASGTPSRLGFGTSGQYLKTQGTGANPTWADVQSTVGGSWRNLAVSRPGVTQVTVTADELVVYTTGLSGVRITAVNVTATITTSGANGLDTGAEAANTIYYVYVIRKSSDGTVAALLSTASTVGTITFPSGYDQATLVSAVGNNNSSDFIKFRQTGRKYLFSESASMASASGTGSWQSVDLTPANMSTNPGFVPSALSNFCFGTHANDGSTNAVSYVTNDSSIAVANSGRNTFADGQSSGGSSAIANSFWQFDLITADTIYFNGSGTVTVWLHGFEINKLGQVKNGTIQQFIRRFS